MKNIRFSDVTITGGYWRHRRQINRDTTLRAVYDRFRETHRFDALKCLWKEGDENGPHIYWDSDIAKWIEGAADMLCDRDDAAIADIIEDAIDCIIENSDENGYYNSYYMVTQQNERFCHRNNHELYCAGHLFEAAVAYYKATGKKRFLKAMCRYADYIEKIFITEKSAGFVTPGHPEIELALMQLYRTTGERRYADMAKYFIDEHGCHPEEVTPGLPAYHNQDDMPLRERTTADGHCVRALYLLCGAAEVAAEYGDDALRAACERCFDNITTRRMYITGGVGSTNRGEAFTVDHHLPNRTAYNETCAAIALAMFSHRMLAFGAHAKYADTVERALYNGVMSGVSEDGRSFFYENPLEIDPDFNHINRDYPEKERFPITQRLEVFDCSCCPPNILRTVASVAGYLYTYDRECIYVHQYMDSETVTDGIRIVQKTAYPACGEVVIRCTAEQKQLAVRIPGWCKDFRIDRDYTLKNGYAYLSLTGDDEITVTFDMPVRLIAANRRVHDNAGRVAIMRGPIVYCAEGVDNGADLKSVSIDPHADFEIIPGDFFLPSLRTQAYRPQQTAALYYESTDNCEEIPLTLIPYSAFANRGETEMQVWLLKKT